MTATTAQDNATAQDPLNTILILPTRNTYHDLSHTFPSTQSRVSGLSLTPSLSSQVNSLIGRSALEPLGRAPRKPYPDACANIIERTLCETTTDTAILCFSFCHRRTTFSLFLFLSLPFNSSSSSSSTPPSPSTLLLICYSSAPFLLITPQADILSGHANTLLARAALCFPSQTRSCCYPNP